MATAHRTLIARNAESFSFIYQENIDRFDEVRFFDPEKDVPSFEDINLLYLPGGYPEKHLEALVKNEACRKAIKAYAERGGRIVAECGGMMYLCEKIVTDNGEYPMCGVLPYAITACKADRNSHSAIGGLNLTARRIVDTSSTIRNSWVRSHSQSLRSTMPRASLWIPLCLSIRMCWPHILICITFKW